MNDFWSDEAQKWRDEEKQLLIDAGGNYCETCGVEIFGGPGVWHDQTGMENCPLGDTFHEPKEKP